MRARDIERPRWFLRSISGSARVLGPLLLLAVLGCNRSVETKGPQSAPSRALVRTRGSDPVECQGISSKTSAELKSALDAAVARNRGYGGGVLRIESGRCGVLWEGASGSVARSGALLDVQDTFEIASLTKVFTAASVLEIVEEGRLGLDTPIGETLPGELTHGLLVVGGRDVGSEITVRELLGHKSGLPDYWSDAPRGGKGTNAFIEAFLGDPDRFWKPESILGSIGELEPAGAPGERYHYSDTGYVLLGLLIERVTGKSLHEVFRERILSPLAMNETYLSYREQPRKASVESHRYEADLDLHGQRRQSADWASGGLVSSTRDLSRFVLALAERKVFERESTLDTMMTWCPTGAEDVDYGLGLFRVRLDEGNGELWGHDGHGNAFMYYWPERQLAFVGTLNQTENDWWGLVASAVGLLK